MNDEKARLNRERLTMEAMVELFCQARHGTDKTLCPECAALMDYARTRLARCRFQEEKPTCVKCPVHCYRTDRREQIREVMRVAGPRMLWRHPLLALAHWRDGLLNRKP